MCTDNCVKFLIDVGLELLIFYEQEYEIYGDIRGASNSFKAEAYEQGKGRGEWGECEGEGIIAENEFTRS